MYCLKTLLKATDSRAEGRQLKKPIDRFLTIRKKVPFVWDEKWGRAFETLKQKLIEPPILAYPCFDGTEIILQTDARYTGLGYILAQMQDGKERVISYGNRSLKNPECNYSTTELEALAVVEGIKNIRLIFNVL